MSHNHPMPYDNLAVDESSPNFYQNVMHAQMTRREVMAGVTAATAVAAGGSLLTACGGAGDLEAPAPAVASIAKSTADRVVIPAGYTATALYSLGDPVKAGIPAYKNDGTDTDFANRAGDHHDALYFFGMNAAGTVDPTISSRGLLCMNHEALTEDFLHTTIVDPARTAARPSDQVLKETEAHGVSIIEVARGASGNGVSINLNGVNNRRITTRTPMVLSGPAAGDARVKHKSYTANGATFGDGVNVQGTLNNCANGYTPWGTYLTCEENWAGYFFRGRADQTRRDDLERYGIRTLNAMGAAADSIGFQGLNWDLASGAEEEYKRFNCTATGATAADDYRNVPNTFGYIVEIDPFSNTAPVKKRTALGRFNHEGCWPAPARAGQPVVFYSGCDGRFEYIYKFVSTAVWDPADLGRGITAGDKYMDSGKLYAAKFSDDGKSGTWLELSPGVNGLSASNGFGTAADIAIVTRRAADIAGATSMDRPEWGAVNPVTGEVFFTLTNNTSRGNGTATELPEIYKGNRDIGADAANPRINNANGHIIRLRETGGLNAATSFEWEIMVFGSRADNTANNISNLNADSEFSSPDGLWMDQRGLLWIQTDDGSNFTTGSTALSNNQMLVTIPGAPGQTPVIRRFLVGPKGCELTGVDITPDGKTMFVNIQHPGEVTTGVNLSQPSTFQSHWPMGSDATADASTGTARPRSTTIVITKNDGGIIGM